MRLSIAVRHMVALGATPAQILAFIEEEEAAAMEVAERQRPLSSTERSRIWRARKAADATDATNATMQRPRVPASPPSQPIEIIEELEKSSDIYNTTTSSKGNRVSSKPCDLASCPENHSLMKLYPGKGGLGGKPKTRARVETTAEFDRFWAVYPRRVEKRKAMQAFLAAVKRGADPEAIIAGAARYAGERAEAAEPQFTKHPTTWLNGDCWLDDPFVTVAKKTPRQQMFDRIFAEIEERNGNGHDSRRSLCEPSDFDVACELPAKAFGRPGNLCETTDYPMHGAAEGDLEADG